MIGAGDGERAPLIILGPEDSQVEAAARGLLTIAEEAWVKNMTLRKDAGGEIRVDQDRRIRDLTGEEKQAILAASEINTEHALEEGRLCPEKYLRPETNPWSPGNIPEAKIQDKDDED